MTASAVSCRLSVSSASDAALDSPRFPAGPLADKWDRHRFESKLVNPANRRKYTVIIVGTGLAGASAASSLGELGYNVLSFCIHDSPRRAHSIAAQGGINAAKNYQNDGDSIQRLFYDTVKGGDYRSREANVYRLAQLSVNIIDQCVAQGVPFAREYGGLLDNRSFGGAQVSRTFYARGQTGQQLLLGAYQSMMRQVEKGTVADASPTARCSTWSSSTARRAASSSATCVTGEIERYAGARRAALHRRIRHRVLPVDQRRELERDGGVARAQARRVLRQPVLHADPPDLHPGLGHAPVEADADEREPPQRRPRLGAEEAGRHAAAASRSPRRSATTTSSAGIRASATSCRATSRRATPRRSATKGAASATAASRSISISPTRSSGSGADVIKARYGNLFDMYTKITDEDPYKVPMRIYPAIHYTMGGLWVDYNLMSTIPGLHVLGEANFSDHGANRLGASALMQGLARRLLRHPLHARATTSAARRSRRSSTDHDAFKEAEACRPGAASIGCCRSRARRRRASCTASSGQSSGTTSAWRGTTPGCARRWRASRELREEFWQNVSVPGPQNNLNKNLEYAGRVADYLEFAELLALDALQRTESCGGHFREESQTPDGEALRDDEHFSYVAAWEFQGVGKAPALHKEPLDVRVREAEPEKLQVDECSIHLKVWRQAGPDTAGQLVPTPPTTSRPTCRSSRCSTSSTRG